MIINRLECDGRCGSHVESTQPSELEIPTGWSRVAIVADGAFHAFHHAKYFCVNCTAKMLAAVAPSGSREGEPT